MVLDDRIVARESDLSPLSKGTSMADSDDSAKLTSDKNFIRYVDAMDEDSEKASRKPLRS